MKATNRNGLELWRGASAIDGSEIVVIAVGVSSRSTNRKTGGMVQTYVLRADLSPVEAVRSGADSSVCGDCKHRGLNGFTGRTCYVNVGQGATSVYRCWKRGGYAVAKNNEWARGRLVRFGTYGDPAAAPFGLWEGIAAVATGWTGYTHQWSAGDAVGDLRLARLLMASCETESEARHARLRGYRVFRTKLPGSADKMAGEAVCPASKESKADLQCWQCLACCGTASGRRGHVGIRAHGNSAVMSNLKKRYPAKGGASCAS